MGPETFKGKERGCTEQEVGMNPEDHSRVQLEVYKFGLLAGYTQVSEWPSEVDFQSWSNIQVTVATILTVT